MAGLTIKTNIGPVLKGLISGLLVAYPQLNYGLLSQVGHDGRQLMKANLLEGNPITLHKYPKDKRGRNTVNWKILKGIKGVRISSYPLNLYDPRAQYRKFNPVLAAKLDQIVSAYDRTKAQKIIDQVDKQSGVNV